MPRHDHKLSCLADVGGKLVYKCGSNNPRPKKLKQTRILGVPLAGHPSLKKPLRAAGRKPAMNEAEKFFHEHAGYGYNPKKETKEQGRRSGAKRLARAEAIASSRGWQYEWEEDPEEWQGDVGERPSEVLTAVLRDEDGNVLASLGGVGLSGNFAEDRRYRRTVEAELALQAASEKGLL